MNSANLIIIFTAVCSFATVASYGNIPIEYKGNTLTVKEYNQLDFCHNKWCLDDAHRILIEMSYNNSVDPCDDFDEFACGTFFRERAYNERYETVGFKTNYRKKIDEKRHRMFKAPVVEEDVKAVKVVKNFYKRCVNSRYIENQSRKEILKYLGSFGKFPNQIANWTEADLNFTKLAIETKLEYFTNFKITHCPSPSKGVEALCLVPDYIYSWSRYSSTNLHYTAKDVREMFELLKFSPESVDEIIDLIKIQPLEFPERQPNISQSNTDFRTIEDFTKQYENFTQVSWIDMFNFQLPDWLQVKKSDELVFLKLYYRNTHETEFINRFIANQFVDKRALAYVILIDILYDYRHLFEVYPFDNKQFKTAIKTPERFELCNRLLDRFMPVAVNAMFSRKYLSRETKEAVGKLMKLAVDDLLSGITDEELSPEDQLKLKKTEIIAGYPDELIEDSFLDRVYEKLTLNGNETLLESFQAMYTHQKFFNLLQLSRNDSRTLKVIRHKREVSNCYLISYKYLYCPATALQFPAFHTDRTQFYNMAMLLPEIYAPLGHAENLAARSYSKWLNLNGPEPTIPGFLLNTEEMFWLALALKRCAKQRDGVGSSPLPRYSEFVATFNCTVNETDEDLETENEDDDLGESTESTTVESEDV